MQSTPQPCGSTLSTVHTKPLGMKNLGTKTHMRQSIGNTLANPSRNSPPLVKKSKSPSTQTNDLLPTNHHLLKMLDNTKVGQCFTCNQLWGDTTHVLTCSCNPRQSARHEAQAQFKQKLSRLHTLNIMTNLICNSTMDSWLS
jgi:hypothetical protein